MDIGYKKYINEYENNRVEYLFLNFDYIDGSDLILNILNKKYNIQYIDILDGIWFITRTIKIDNIKCKLIWCEDIGNYIYSINQDENIYDYLEKILDFLVFELNKTFIEYNKNKFH